MEDRLTREKSLVPWLGEIPLLGWLFRWQRDKVDKNNLMIFLTPTIVREDQDVEKYFESKKRRMQEYKARHKITEKYQDILPFREKTPPVPAPGVEQNSAFPENLEPAPTKAPDPAGPASLYSPEAAKPGYSVTIRGARPLEPAPEETVLETGEAPEPRP